MLILLAFALRLYDLDGQSMWSDEGLSLYRARLPLGDVFANRIVVDGVATTDTNPPFYFLLLHGWRALVGESVFLLRYLGILLATLAVPLIYLLGRLPGGAAPGLVAALLLAVSPFHVWQSQVLRNYGLLLTFNLFSVYGLGRYLLAGRQSRWLILWLAGALLGIYTHFFGFFVFAFGLAALGLAIMTDVRGRRLLQSRRFWLLVALFGLLALPVIQLAWSRFQAGQQIDFFPVALAAVLRHAASAFAVGMSPTLEHPWWLWLPGVVLAGLGLIGARRRRTAFWLLVGYLTVPLGLMLLVSLVNPLYNGTRHLLIGLPPFLLLAAWGIAGLRRWARVLAWSLGGVLLAVQLASLWSQYYAPELVRDDVRGAAAYLTEVTTAADVVVLHDTLIRFTFDYYYDGAAPIVAIPAFDLGDAALAETQLRTAGEQARLVWFLVEPTPRTGFDRRALSTWADRHWVSLQTHEFPWLWLPVQLRAYLPEPVAAALPAGATSVKAHWPGVMRLHGAQLPGTLQAGQEWWPTLYLEGDGAPPVQYSLMFELREPGGRVWAQMAEPPGGAIFPPASWPAGEMVALPLPLSVPAGLPPGAYELTLRLMETESGHVIPLSSGGSDTPLGEVEVMAAPCSALYTEPALPWRTRGFRGGLQLQSAEIPAAEYLPGHAVGANLLWCAGQALPADYQALLQLVDGAGKMVAEHLNPLSRADYPPAAWQPDTLAGGRADVGVPASAPPGRYRLRLSLVDPQTGEPLRASPPWLGRSLNLGEVSVAAWPMETELPEIDQTVRADFGDPILIELHGYELSNTAPEPGTAVQLTLLWRAATDVDTVYDVLVHLADEDGNIVGQADGPPTGGFRLTTSWRAGEVIVDERMLQLPAEPGAYDLWIGLYGADSLIRLPATQEGELQPDNRVLLTTVTVGSPDG
jgi:4-amino-4-deoxy-L-arabinose transferase-like glycosyltransferase